MNSRQTVRLNFVIFTFVAFACFMIWWTPKGSLMQQEYKILHKGKEEHRLEINVGSTTQSEDDGSPTNYLIFDSIKHDGSLEFLDSLSYKWEIVVVNADKDQLESCLRCQVVKESWTGKFLSAEMASPTWKKLPDSAKGKIVAILYALLNSAEWMYVTDSQFLPKEDVLLFACVNKVTTI